MDAPVAMLVFNRPAHTARVFEAIRAARPRVLLVVADGPRPDVRADVANCREVRAIFDGIDWPCELIKIFSDENLGCRQRIGSGISEVFKAVDSCTFLEDDCLPHPSFFPFCSELLERYAYDERVMVISGDGFPSAVGNLKAEYSYYFTNFVHIWGWASWRRAWSHYDGSMSSWPSLRDSGWLRGRLPTFTDRLYWALWFEMCHDGRLNTWDVPWLFSCWAADGLAICPDRNLVSNIGFDSTGTHTLSPSPLASLPTRSMDFPLRHPPREDLWQEAERWTRTLFTGSRRQRWARLARYLRQGIKAGI